MKSSLLQNLCVCGPRHDYYQGPAPIHQQTSGRIRGRVGDVKAHVKGFQGFPDKIFALNTTVIGLNGDTFLRPRDSGVWCRGTEHEEETIVGMIFAEQRGDENIQHMCFVHDMDILLQRIQNKWGLNLELLP